MSERFFRTLTLERGGATDGVGAVLATETPVLRDRYWEVLSCAPGDVDLRRASCNGLPLLHGHDHDGAIVGRVQKIHADGRALRGTLVPATNPRAREVWQDIDAGVATDLSIGYTVKQSSARETGTRDGLPILRFTDWAPHEVSVVNIPADAAAGIGRNLSLKERPEMSAALRAKFVDPKKIRFDEDPPAFDLAAFVRSRLGGPEAPAEDHESARLAASSRRVPELGNLIPAHAIGRRDLVTGTGASGGFLSGTATLPALVDVLRPYLVGKGLGVPSLTVSGVGAVRVRRRTAGAAGGWAAEGVAPAEDANTFGEIPCSPKKLAAYLDYTRSLLLQAENLETFLGDDLAGAFAAALGLALLNGSGSAGQPTGILSTTGIGSVSGTTWTIDAPTDAVQTVASANVPLSGPGVGWVTAPLTYRLLARRAMNGAGSRYFIEDGKLLGYPVFQSTAMPAATALFGNFAEGAMFIFWGKEIDVLVNPFSGAKNQLVSIVGHVHADVAVIRPAAFCAVTSIS